MGARRPVLWRHRPVGAGDRMGGSGRRLRRVLAGFCLTSPRRRRARPRPGPP
jgi:hypothetical protein